MIFSSEPVDPEIDSAGYAELQKENLSQEFPGYRQIAWEPMRMLGGREGRLNRFEWQPTDGPRVTQIQIYYVEGERGYTATATAYAEDFPHQSRVLTEILDRLRIDDVPAGAQQETDPSLSLSVRDNSVAEQYELLFENEVAGKMEYRLRSSLIASVHTEVFERFQGRGWSDQLIARALEDAKEHGREVLPFCPLVAAYIQDHPEWISLVPEDRRADFGL